MLQRALKRSRSENHEIPARLEIFTTPELMEIVTAFQNGIPHDMTVFLVFDPKRLRSRKLEDGHGFNMQRVHETIAKWLDQFGYSRLPKLFRALAYMRYLVVVDAIYYNQMVLAKYLHDTFDLSTIQGNFLDLAVHLNNLRMLEFLHACGCQGCTTDAMDTAAKNGHLDMVQFLHTHRSEGCTSHGLALATIHGHNDVVLYLRQHGLADYEKDWLKRALVRKHCKPIST
ncbi:hypothetical protein AC1031_010751 [Aphanomyces cochlioides]|nr:hypothetical protein AC1031_010751 [Aphanomyces cochlioides]